MKTQKECVFGIVSGMMDINGVVKPTKEQLKEVYEMVAQELFDGTANFSDEARAKYPTLEAIRKEYVPGMVSNWLRKDLRLNGGQKYETKNPGSRAGSGDEVLKNLKALKTTLTEPEHIAAVDAEIAARLEILGKTAKKTVTIDLDKIPEELRNLLGLAS